MHNVAVYFLVSFLIVFDAYGADLGFRFKNGKCINEKGVEGLNPSYFGQCSNLEGTKLGRFDFSGIDFSGSNLRGTDFRFSILAQTKMINVNAKGAIFSGVNLSEANFTGAQLDNAKFVRANLSVTLLNSISAVGADFSGAQMVAVELNKSNFSEAIFDEALLDDSMGQNSVFTQASFKNSQINRVKLIKGNFEKIMGNRSDWVEADLRNSSFKGAFLKRSNFFKANIKGVNFDDSNLARARVETAQYNKETTFKNAIYSKSTTLPLSENEIKDNGMSLVADCNPSSDVEFDLTCYYLDGSGGNCVNGYKLAPQSIFPKIQRLFVGKNYRTKTSTNCCIWHADIESELQDYGMDGNDCNGAGPIKSGPVLNGASCTDANNREPGQLTVCMSID